MSNPLVCSAIAHMRAIQSLKLKGGSTIRNSRDGTVIVQRGKPDLLLTWEAAQRFSDEMDEAEHG